MLFHEELVWLSGYGIDHDWKGHGFDARNIYFLFFN